MARTNKEVFGTSEVTPIPKALIKERLMLLDKRMAELTLVHFLNQDIASINQCTKDIDYWKDMRERENG